MSPLGVGFLASATVLVLLSAGNGDAAVVKRNEQVGAVQYLFCNSRKRSVTESDSVERVSVESLIGHLIHFPQAESVKQVFCKKAKDEPSLENVSEEFLQGDFPQAPVVRWLFCDEQRNARRLDLSENVSEEFVVQTDTLKEVFCDVI